MSLLRTFEVVVRVKRPSSEFWDGKRFHRYKYGKLLKMFHIDARNHKQASKRAERYGYPVKVRKADVGAIIGDIESLELDQPVNPYVNAIAMDEMVWKKKSKRAERLKNQIKDRQNIDKTEK